MTNAAGSPPSARYSWPFPRELSRVATPEETKTTARKPAPLELDHEPTNLDMEEALVRTFGGGQLVYLTSTDLGTQPMWVKPHSHDWVPLRQAYDELQAAQGSRAAAERSANEAEQASRRLRSDGLRELQNKVEALLRCAPAHQRAAVLDVLAENRGAHTWSAVSEQIERRIAKYAALNITTSTPVAPSPGLPEAPAIVSRRGPYRVRGHDSFDDIRRAQESLTSRGLPAPDRYEVGPAGAVRARDPRR